MINVYFDVVDSAGRSLYSRLHITPFNAPLSYDGQIVSSDSVLLREFYAPAMVELVPNTYEVKLFGKNTVSQFLLTLPTSSDGMTVSASAYIVSCPPYPGITSSYAVVAGGLTQNPSTPVLLWDTGYNDWVALTSVDGVLGVSNPI